MRSRHLFPVWLLMVDTSSAGCGLTAVSREEEIQMGRQTATQIEREHKTREDEKVTRLGQKMAAVSDRPDYPYRFRVIEQKEINAFALPGGPVYVTSKMMEFVKGHDDQLAALLGHEVTHVARRHAAQQIQRQAWLGIGIQILTRGTLQTAALLAANLEELGYSRQHEREADRYGAVYLVRAGMDPDPVAALMERMAAEEKGSTLGFLRTHPGGNERARLLRGAIASGQIRQLAETRTPAPAN